MENLRSVCDNINNALDLDVRPEDILNPDSERLQYVLRTFLVATMNIPESSMVNLPLLDCDASEFQETHSRSIPLSLLFVTMNSFVADFSQDQNNVLSISDLTMPEPKVTRRLYTLVSEFLKFHSKYDSTFSEVAKQYEGQRKQLDDALAMIEFEEKKKVSLRNQEDSRKRRENALLAEIGQKSTQLQQLLKQAEMYESKREECCKSIEEEKEERVKLLLEKDSLNAQLDHISKGIIKSPQRVLKELDHQREDLQRMREDCNNTRQKTNELKARIELAPSIDKIIDNLWEEVNKLNVVKIQHDENNAEKMEVERSVADSERKLNQVSEQVRSTERQIVELQDSVEKDCEMHRDRLEQLNQRFMDLEGDILNLREMNKDVKSDCRKKQKELALIRSKRNEIIRDAESEIATMTTMYQEMMSKYSLERASFFTNMNKLKEAFRAIYSVAAKDDYWNLTGNTSIIL